MPKRSTRSSKDSKAKESKNTKVKGTDSANEQEVDAQILGVMLMFHEDEKRNIKVGDVANELGCHERKKSFRERWSLLQNTGLLGKCKTGGGVELTKAGLDKAATPEYKARMKELAIVPKTNEEHQEKIKKFFKKSKSAAIFDFLLTYGSLSKDQLSALVGQNKRSHGFHYSFNEVRDKGYLEEDQRYSENKKAFRLTDKAFKSKEDRPKETDISADKLEKEVSQGYDRIESQKQGPRSSNKKVKKEDQKKVKEEKAEKSEDLDEIKKEHPVKKEDSAKIEAMEVDEENEREIVPVISADGGSDHDSN